QREEPKRPFGESREVDDGTLDPKEKQGANLAIVERAKQVGIAAMQQVHRHERLIPPEWKVQEVASHTQERAQHKKPQQDTRLHTSIIERKFEWVRSVECRRYLQGTQRTRHFVLLF